MAITTISSREFNQDAGKAKKAAQKGPVIITDRGKPAHVLMTIAEYQRLTGDTRSIVELLSMPEAAEVDFAPARLEEEVFKPAELH